MTYIFDAEDQVMVLERYSDLIGSVPDAPHEASICRLIEEFVVLPNREVQLPWIGAYLLSHTGLLKAAKSRIPYLFCHGPSRSGKTRIAKLAALLSGSKLQNSSSSAAGIRQSIEDSHNNQIGYYFFLWDDLSRESLSGSNGQIIYSFLKGGYDATTSLVSIGGKDGSPVLFDTFGLKIFSSCAPLHRLHSLVELSNRMLVIQHEHIPAQLGDDPTEWCWDGTARLIEEFWDPTGYGFAQWKKYKRIVKEQLKIPKIWDDLAAKKTLWVDLVATGCAVGIFQQHATLTGQVTEALKAACRFAKYEEQTYSQSSPLLQWVMDTMIQIGEHYDHIKEEDKRVHVVPAKLLNQLAVKAFEEALLTVKPSPEEIQEILESKGYSLKPAGDYHKKASYQKLYRRGLTNA